MSRPARHRLWNSRDPGRAGVALATLVGAALLGLASCNTANVLAPPPPLRAASAASFALDVEFAEPLSRSSAEDPSHYTLTAVGGGTAAVASATLVDTLNGRVVQLVVPDWLSTDPDGTDWTVATSGVLTVYGRSTGTRSLTFRAGLSYSAPLKSLFDARCTSCHGPSRVEGSYRTDSHSGLLGNGVDAIPDLIPGNVDCLLVRKCKPHNSMFNLGELTFFDFELIRNWVTNFNARP